MGSSTYTDARTPASGAVPLSGPPAEGRGRWWMHLLGPLAALAVLAPMALSGQFYLIDWQNHLFLIDHQAEALRLLGHPTYFVNTDVTGAASPFFMFYGGTLYATAAAIAVVLGSSIASLVITYIAGCALAYGGSWWLGRLAGLDAYTAHLPAVVVVTGAFYISNAYGLGHWPEFMAVSSIPALVATAAATVLRDRVRLRVLAGFFLAAVLFTGSHNITALWGSLFLLAVGAATAVAIRAWRLEIPWRRVAVLAGVGLLAVGVNLWYLIPDIVYASKTFVYINLKAGAFNPDYNRDLGEPWALFHPGRDSFNHDDGVFVQAPVYALLWGLVAFGAVTIKRPTLAQLKRVSAGLLIVLAVFVVLLCFASLWSVLPSPLKGIQSPERLSSYITLGVAGLFIAGLLAVRHSRHRRRWLLAAVGVAAIQAGLAQYQALSYDGRGPASEIIRQPFDPVNAYTLSNARLDYRLNLGRVLDPQPRLVLVSPGDFADGTAVVRRETPPRDPNAEGVAIYSTNVVYSPLLRVGGDAFLVGRDPEGLAILGVPQGRAPWQARFSTALTAPAKLGIAGTAASLLTAVLGLAAAVVIRRRRRAA